MSGIYEGRLDKHKVKPVSYSTLLTMQDNTLIQTEKVKNNLGFSKDNPLRILTFDFEDWFHLLEVPGYDRPKDWVNLSSRIEDNLNWILSVLKSTNQTATFFILGWVAEKYPDLVKKIVEYGHHLGTHSYAHRPIQDMSRSEFKIDLHRSIEAIKQASGQNVDCYRAPGFSIVPGTEWVFSILKDLGIEIDASLFPLARAHGGYKQLSISGPSIVRFKEIVLKEFPMSYASIGFKNIPFFGGGYFRILPYFLIRYFSSYQDYLMTYFHPRDFDKEQPVIPELSYKRRLKSYIGLSFSQKKLIKLLKDFNFISISQADKLVQWNNVKKVFLKET